MKNKIIILWILFGRVDVVNADQVPSQWDKIDFSYDSLPEVLPGTKLLDWDISADEMSKKMLEGAHQLIEGKIQEAVLERSNKWERNFSSPQSYERSVDPNRRRLMQYIGVIHKSDSLYTYNVGLEDKYPPVVMEKISINEDPELVAETEGYRIYQVRWPVLNRVNGEGLLLQPKTKPIANIIALPDADQTPEQLAGLSPGIPHQSQFARRMVENGYQVLIPVLISRALLFPEEAQKQTYREWIYRQAFHMGRHLIGFEAQKIISAIDWFKQSAHRELKVGVAGYGEGGLLAFYTAAVDKRIDAVLVSGYFSSREQVWDEPIYRNVWGLLTEFGDAEVASLIAPRPLVIEYSSLPEPLEKSTEKPSDFDPYTYSGYKGSLLTPTFDLVETEFKRIDNLIKPDFQKRFLISGEGDKPVTFGSESAMIKFTQQLGLNSSLPLSDELPEDNRSSFNPEERQWAQVKEIEAHVQGLMRDSDKQRNEYFLYKAMPEFAKKDWSTKRYHPYYDPQKFIEKRIKFRKILWEEVLGKFEDPYLPPNPLSRKIYDEELWTGYEVVLDVYKNFIAPGVLLIPKDIKAGEKRPVVVCQHGRNGVPQNLIHGNTSYYDMAAKLADQGFVVYAPYGLFNGEDRYRWLDRKANTIKKTLFSFMISQHEQTLDWLATLPFVDSSRIAFYGKSYGGEAAMRIPAVLEGYCLSICSADFGDWTRKVVDTHYENSFMNTIEWEMPYFNMGSTFSYAEMAYLIFPRPFMVERGRHDLVQPDEWVAYEYAKVSHFYDQFNLGDKTEIEYFNGGHASRNEGTFQFFHKHLNWP